ncbi:MAG: phytanoyl-CoA dioxygenase family protein [Gammaproteobacteria bacterium]|nr:phytanoyl-CoA dioxygenase family protein [Gammaproteobacteria bacterium]MDE0442450.1 phytanoyl-CoA dioxygenase family protein [Gammaproteobacteria bacterium]
MDGDLADYRVHGPTPIGWDPATLPNEVVDDEGIPLRQKGFGEPDPRTPAHRVPDDPEVQALREHLRANNGIPGLEVCTPDEVHRAARIYRRDGFVVVRDALDEEHLALFREGCARRLKEILSYRGRDGRKYMAETGRLPHRYCYGTTSGSRQMMHDPAWTSMIDLPTTTPILTEIFATDDYLVWGGGGDLSLPGAIEYQHLHTDGVDTQPTGDHAEARLAYFRCQGGDVDPAKSFADLDFRTQRLVMDRTPTGVTINFTMTDLTWENGPIREIPGTHTATQPPPVPDEEPEWMRLSTLVGAPAGSAIFRDVRTWHGATPNLSREIRALPSIEYSAGWRSGSGSQKTMPYEIWETLSPHAQRICRFIRQEPGVWPYGAGVMHPLTSGRRAAYEHDAGDEGEVTSVRTDPRSAGTAIRLFNRDHDGGY